ncbi:hypothetical protein TNCV_3657381 [Trichonephila clavipes]|nr:hypothetical protein TNCV_3657381 [Trichonephila clavipes]
MQFWAKVKPKQRSPTVPKIGGEVYLQETSTPTTFPRIYTPSSSARKTLHCREVHLLPEVNPIRRSLPLSKLSSIQFCVT